MPGLYSLLLLAFTAIFAGTSSPLQLAIASPAPSGTTTRTPITTIKIITTTDRLTTTTKSLAQIRPACSYTATNQIKLPTGLVFPPWNASKSAEANLEAQRNVCVNAGNCWNTNAPAWCYQPLGYFTATPMTSTTTRLATATTTRNCAVTNFIAPSNLQMPNWDNGKTESWNIESQRSLCLAKGFCFDHWVQGPWCFVPAGYVFPSPVTTTRTSKINLGTKTPSAFPTEPCSLKEDDSFGDFTSRLVSTMNNTCNATAVRTRCVGQGHCFVADERSGFFACYTSNFPINGTSPNNNSTNPGNFSDNTNNKPDFLKAAWYPSISTNISTALCLSRGSSFSTVILSTCKSNTTSIFSYNETTNLVKDNATSNCLHRPNPLTTLLTWSPCGVNETTRANQRFQGIPANTTNLPPLPNFNTSFTPFITLIKYVGTSLLANETVDGRELCVGFSEASEGVDAVAMLVECDNKAERQMFVIV